VLVVWLSVNWWSLST